MPYPTSSDVSSGQPTAALHYNQLRADALRLGHPADSAATLGALLARFASPLRLEYMEVNRVRVPASADQPACLVIDGAPLAATAPVDLPVGSTPEGPAMLYYVFAVRSTGRTDFSLDINTSPQEAAGRRRIGRFFWDGDKIQRGSIRGDEGERWLEAGGVQQALRCDGRLSLSASEPVSTLDITAAGTLYFTPRHGNLAALYTGCGWRLHRFEQLAVSLGGLPGEKNFDVFLNENGSTLALELEMWSSDVTRAASLDSVDGVLTAAAAPEYRYLGTLRTSGPGQCDDAVGKRLLWNQYNREKRTLARGETLASWASTVAAYRALNGDSANRVEFVLGTAETPVTAQVIGAGKTTGGAVFSLGIGLDSTQANAATQQGMAQSSAFTPLSAGYAGFPGEGYHSLTILEFGGAGVTFMGTNLLTGRCGLLGWLDA